VPKPVLFPYDSACQTYSGVSLSPLDWIEPDFGNSNLPRIADESVVTVGTSTRVNGVLRLMIDGSRVYTCPGAWGSSVLVVG